MTPPSPTYRLEQPGDNDAIEALHESLFGPERFARAAYVLRDGVAPDPGLSFVAERNGHVVGSVRMTPIAIGGRPALILGPLTVSPEVKGKGIGKTLVRMDLAAARVTGHSVVLLVGDLPYYAPLGFTHLGRDVITLPAPVDPDRVLVAGLHDGALDGLAGPAEGVRTAGAART